MRLNRLATVQELRRTNVYATIAVVLALVAWAIYLTRGHGRTLPLVQALVVTGGAAIELARWYRLYRNRDSYIDP